MNAMEEIYMAIYQTLSHQNLLNKSIDWLSRV